MRKSKIIQSFTDKLYINALFLQSPISLKLYKNRLKMKQLFYILKGLHNLENSAIYPQE